MALNTSELQRCKYELGFNQLQVGAEPYIGVTRYFEQIVLPNLNTGTLTSSATVVTGTGVSTPVSLTLGTVVGVSVMDRVVVDVDSAQEEATVQSVAGSAIVVSLSKSHGSAGAYPVSVEGGESMVRWHLSRLRVLADRIDKFGARAGVKKADEVEFFGGSGRGGNQEHSGFRTLEDMRQYFRSELCKLLFGVGSIQNFGGSGSRIGVY